MGKVATPGCSPIMWWWIATMLMPDFRRDLRTGWSSLSKTTKSPRLELAWTKGSAQEIGVQTWLHFKERFDSKEMKPCRQKLAQQLSHYDQAKHDETTEDLFDLFEDIGSVYHRGLLDKKAGRISV
jgi:hypothetical protein